MEQEAGSWAWAVAIVGGPVVFGAVVAWLMVWNRRRRRGGSNVSDKAGGAQDR